MAKIYNKISKFINNYLLYILMFVMLCNIASLFVPQLKYVGLIICAVVVLFTSFSNSLCFILALLPLYILFRIKFNGTNYDIIFFYICEVTLIQGIRYLIDIFAKRKTINWAIISVSVVLLILSFVGFDKGAILRILRAIAILALFYIILNYVDEIDFAKICKYVGFSLAVTLVAGIIIGRIQNYRSVVWYTIDNRFMGFTGNANNIAIICILELIFVLINLFYNKVSFTTFFVLTTITSLNGFLTKGKAYLILFIIAFIIYMIWRFIKNKKRAFIELLICLIAFGTIFLVFREQIVSIFERFFNDWEGDSLIDKILTGRYSIWKVYITDWASNLEYILFGRGFGYFPKEQLLEIESWLLGPHSDYVFLLYYFGVIGVIFFCALLTLYFLEYKKIGMLNKKTIIVLSLSLIISFTNNILCTEFAFLYLIVFVGGFNKEKVIEREKFDYNSVVITKENKSKMKISVLMSVYKNDIAENFETAIKSVMNQSYKPSQIVIVRDGVVGEDIQKVINKYKKNKIFTIIERENNIGLGKTLAEGSSYCKYEYIARMDADDISLPNRFEKEIKCFILDPNLSAVSSNGVEFVDTPSNLFAIKKVPESDEEINNYMKSRNPMNHMVSMIKKSVLELAGGYQDWYYAEDWYLWVRMKLAGAKFYNIQENLIFIRINQNTYGRRHGMKYFKSINGLLKYIHKNKMSTFAEYSKSAIIRFVGHVAVPQRLKNILFKKFLRKGEIDDDTKNYSLHLAGEGASSKDIW